MTITAKVIEDSISPAGKRLTSLQLCYPRFIHAEFKTHRILSSDSANEVLMIEQSTGLMDDRDLSRNASSSRAIPVTKVIEQVRRDPAMPIHWGANQSGMQARQELDERHIEIAKDLWLTAARNAAEIANHMMETGLHKQVANRILEPFQHIHVIVTATEWTNFFELRAHPDAQPEIQALAVAMSEAMMTSTKRRIVTADQNLTSSWHLPYVTMEERLNWASAPLYLARLSAARCARVSYANHDGTSPDHQKDLELFDMLVGSRPLHASPVEHQAFPLADEAARSRNFVGWHQFREDVENGFKSWE